MPRKSFKPLSERSPLDRIQNLQPVSDVFMQRMISRAKQRPQRTPAQIEAANTARAKIASAILK